MSDPHPIHLYLYPLAFFCLGLALFYWTGWLIFLVLLSLLGIISSIHILVVDIIRERGRYVESETYRLEALQKMDMEMRYQLGLAKLPTTVSVRIDKTDVEGNALSISWRKAPIEPWQMKVIAQACLQGRPFSIREWTPVSAGRLLTDPKYRELEAWLQKPVPEHPEIKFIAPRHPTDNRQGFEWTEAGKKLLQQCLDEPLYAPRSPYEES